MADDARAAFRMIGLSVAVGRFVEALFWAIFRVAGVVAGVAVLVLLGLGLLWLILRRLWKAPR